MKSDLKTNVSIDVRYWVEDGVHFCHYELLDIVGYGYTQQEAQESFEHVFKETLKYLTKAKIN